MKWSWHSVLQTLQKPKFLMPDLLVYLNLPSLIQTELLILIHYSVIQSSCPRAKPIFANVFIAPSCLLTCYVKDIQPRGSIWEHSALFAKEKVHNFTQGMAETLWTQSHPDKNLSHVTARIESSGIPQPCCPCAGRARLEKVLDCVPIKSLN